MKHYLLIAVSALALAACGQEARVDTAETAPGNSPSATQQAGRSAAEFVQTAATSDAFEIQSSELAAQRASRQEVKDLAARMVTAHRQTTQQLTQLASANNLPTPAPQLNATQRASLDNLRNQTGAAFDDAYLDAQVAAHENAVRAFEDYATNGESGPLREWAQQTLPSLRHHLSEVRNLENAT
jgi:putative membrane protein